MTYFMSKTLTISQGFLVILHIVVTLTAVGDVLGV